MNLKRNVRVGVNPFDLSVIPPFILANLLKDSGTNEWRIRQDKPIIVDKDRPDEQCIEFVCGLLIAATCIDLLRNEGRHNGNNESVRAYMKRGEGKWTRLPYSAVLTIVDHGSGAMRLNEKWFPIIEEPEPVVIKQSSFVFRGKKG